MPPNIDRRSHRFIYPGPRKDWKSAPPDTHMRDEGANYEITLALLERGIAWPGETIINKPPRVAPRRMLPWEECLEIDLWMVRPGDFLQLTTRPPKTDIYQGAQKQVEPGNTKLERVVFDIFDPFLKDLARPHIRLAERAQASLAEHLQDRREVFIYQREYGFYKEVNPGTGWRDVEDTLKGKSPAFMLRVDELWPGGPGLIAAFGMCSVSTLAWCWRLRHDWAHLLDEPGFHYVDLTPKPLPERSTDHRWASEWEVEEVLSMPIEGS